MAALHTHILDVRPAGLGDLQPVQAQQDGRATWARSKRSAVNSSRASSPRSRPGPSDGETSNQNSPLAFGRVIGLPDMGALAGGFWGGIGSGVPDRRSGSEAT
jgi:hypothetical protein